MSSAILAGIVVVALLFVLRTHEKVADSAPGANPTTTTLTTAAKKLELRVQTSDEILNWIRANMKASGKPLGVVNIWATWCEPCRDEMPEFAKFQKTELAPVFLISADNEIDDAVVRSFLSEKGVDFESTMIKGDQQIFIEKWQALSSKDPQSQWSMTLPATFLVNASGDVLSFHVGTTTASQLADLVKKTP